MWQNFNTYWNVSRLLTFIFSGCYLAAKSHLTALVGPVYGPETCNDSAMPGRGANEHAIDLRRGLRLPAGVQRRLVQSEHMIVSFAFRGQPRLPVTDEHYRRSQRTVVVVS